MIRLDRMISNPLTGVGRAATRGTRTRIRRAFGAEELARLFKVSAERKPLYVTAVHTGLRRGELAKLLWSDVYLDASLPHLRVRASTTKNGREARLRLHADVLEVLGELRTAEPAAPTLTNSITDFRRSGASGVTGCHNARAGGDGQNP